MTDVKSQLWEEKYSDNFQPSPFIRLLQKFERFRADVIYDLIPKKGETLVDLACGDGALLFRCREQFNKLIGIDVARNRIANAEKIAQEQGIKNATFKLTDLDNGIPLKDGEVDVIVCEASLLYLHNIDFTFQEVHRVLKKGGVFIVQVPNYAFIVRRFVLLFGNLPKTSAFSGFDDGGSLHNFTFSLLQKWLESYGFNVSAKTNSGVFSQVRGVWPELLSSDIIYKVVKK